MKFYTADRVLTEDSGAVFEPGDADLIGVGGDPRSGVAVLSAATTLGVNGVVPLGGASVGRR